MNRCSNVCSLVTIILLFDPSIFQNVKSDPVKMEPDEIKNKWIVDFKSRVETFAEKVLNITEIKKQLNNNRKNDEVKLIDEMAEFDRIYSRVLLRLSTVHSVVLNLKSVIEKELDDQEHGTPSKALVPLPVCCDINQGQYEGRLRQKVDITRPCVGTRTGDLFRTDVWASLQRLQHNYVDTPTVLWQYFSTVNGNFIQYPTSNRHCDDQGRLISPLTQEWFVDKLFMEMKNLVIVYDVGASADVIVGPGNMTLNMYIQEAVLRILDTLSPDDHVNVVAFNSTAYVPAQCDVRLFVANQVNCDKIRRFLSTTKVPAGGSDYTSGLLKAYELLITEKQNSPEKFEERSSQLILLTPGKPTNSGTEKLFTTISNKQKELDRKVFHFVYTFDDSLDDSANKILSSIAHQDVPGWPGINNLTFMPPVGPRGDYHKYNATSFVQGAATFYRQIGSRPVTKPVSSVTVLGPKPDPHSGLIMTSTIPVFHNNTVYGVAAVDTSLSTIFAEILNFDIGVHSYAFLMEKQHGQVLLHPKLRPPDEVQQESPVFPHLSVVEPTLNNVQIFNLTHAAQEKRQLRAQVTMGRSSYKSGILQDNSTPQNVTLVYSKIHGTRFVLVLVKFDLDSDILVPQHLAQDLKLHAPYHRLDMIAQSPVHNKPQDDYVCSYEDSFIATQESVIKLSPAVFVNPEQYKYSKENVMQILEVNSFLEHSKDTSKIRLEIKEEIEHILKSTNEIDNLWRPTAKQVLERFFGTPTGVLRIFPGMPFPNTYDHLRQFWFRRSVALSHQFVFTSGLFSHFSKNKMVLITKAVSENIESDGKRSPLVKQLQGVAGVVISHRQLTAMLYQTSGCGGPDVECHLLDNNGFLMTSAGSVRTSRHIIQQFPWLADHLIHTGKMQPFWCTSLSEGQHRLSYSVTLTFDQRTHPNKCESYVIGSITGTNLFLLVLYNRTKFVCEGNFNDTNTCVVRGNILCNKCLNSDLACESPCQCLADFDQCSNHYSLHGLHTTACYNDPLIDDHLPPSFLPTPPGNNVKNCSVPCVSLEDKDECLRFPHCQWQGDYPTCIWKNNSDIVLPASTTTGVPEPPRKPGTKQTTASLSGPNSPQTVPVNSPPPKKTTYNPLSSGSVTTKRPAVSHSSTLSEIVTSEPLPATSTIDPAHQATPSRGNMPERNRKTESTDDRTGLVIGLIITAIVVILIAGLVIYKIRKRFKYQSDANNTRKGSIFDGVFFKRTSERAELTQSSRPYQHIM
ncbi:VWFA and cache domain-containing protein 1-like [Ylistrum balloti]|uniref:VWFA and cache domain-containing protein 1-like n=1 Tax=Ylistrum balloti TaxID=509963 RepID=UPI002905B295|nr:VWFA and cache domain-containing protein 1-like [Ylistrum balloti]